jgi:hypothetical protein
MSLRRREFIAALACLTAVDRTGGAATAWPPATQAQQRALPVVGCVSVVAGVTATEREVACVKTPRG